MATLELHGLRKSFGDTPVLHGIDLALADGEMLVIVGASGCGKSTLLRLVAGLETPTAGRVVLDGRDVTSAGPVGARHRHGVPELRALSAYDRVRQHGLRAAHPRPAGAPRSAGAWRRRPGCSGSAALLARKPRQLSGGQRQRVAMGRAIVREPKLFLFDEPLSNLDAKLRVQMRAEIRRLQRRLGVTSLYVTHDQVEAMTLGRPAAGAAPGPAGAARHADGGVRAARRHLRRRLHRRAGDELPRGGTRGEWRGGPPPHGSIDSFPGRGVRGGQGAAAYAWGPPGASGNRSEWPSAWHRALGGARGTVGFETVVHGRTSAGEAVVMRLSGAVEVQDRLSAIVSAAHLHVFDRDTGARLACISHVPWLPLRVRMPLNRVAPSFRTAAERDVRPSQRSCAARQSCRDGADRGQGRARAEPWANGRSGAGLAATDGSGRQHSA